MSCDDVAARPPRYAFVRVIDLMLGALTRVDPDLAQRAVAVVDVAHKDGVSARAMARVLACTSSARAMGVRPGQTGHQARTVAPDVVLRGWSVEAVHAARAALLDAVATVGARVEAHRAGVWVDIGELARLHASEAGLGAALTQCARKVGLRASVGIASGRTVARVAARRGGVTIVPAEGAAGFLAPLPVGALSLSDDLRGDLARLGVTTLGELARLPIAAAGTRLGDEAAQAIRVAQGVDDAPLIPQPLPTRFEESMDLDAEVEALEPMLFILRRLVSALVQRLALRSLGVGGLALTLQLMERVVDARTLPIAAPTRDVTALVRFLHASLEAQPPVAAVRSVRIVALPRAMRAVQLGLFEPPGPAPDKLALTLTRLLALVGDGRVGAPVAPDTHHPHAVAVAAFDPPRTPCDEGEGASLALHVYRPPREVEVLVHDGRLTRVHAGEVHGAVVRCGGPWRVDGAWWGAAFDHEGYDVELDDGGVYLVAYDRAAGRWCLDGVYE